MQHYTNINDLDSLQKTVQEAISLKNNELQFKNLGEGKTICLLFFNNSLRTRLSTQKAAQNSSLPAGLSPQRHPVHHAPRHPGAGLLAPEHRSQPEYLLPE